MILRNYLERSNIFERSLIWTRPKNVMQSSWKIRVKRDNKDTQVVFFLRYVLTSLHAKREFEMMKFTEIHLSFLIFVGRESTSTLFPCKATQSFSCPNSLCASLALTSNKIESLVRQHLPYFLVSLDRDFIR